MQAGEHEVPVSAAVSARAMVSGSRISPMTRMSGSSRSASREAGGEVAHVAADLPLPREPCAPRAPSRYSIGSSSVISIDGAAHQRLLRERGEGRALARARRRRRRGRGRGAGRRDRRAGPAARAGEGGRRTARSRRIAAARPVAGLVDVDAEAAEPSTPSAQVGRGARRERARASPARPGRGAEEPAQRRPAARSGEARSGRRRAHRRLAVAAGGRRSPGAPSRARAAPRARARRRSAARALDADGAGRARGGAKRGAGARPARSRGRGAGRGGRRAGAAGRSPRMKTASIASSPPGGPRRVIATRKGPSARRLVEELHVPLGHQRLSRARGGSSSPSSSRSVSVGILGMTSRFWAPSANICGSRSLPSRSSFAPWPSTRVRMLSMRAMAYCVSENHREGISFRGARYNRARHDDPARHLPWNVRGGPDRGAEPLGPLRQARGGRLPLRLRGGDAAADDPLRHRLRHGGGLLHALPRRPLPGHHGHAAHAGDAEHRGIAHALRPAARRQAPARGRAPRARRAPLARAHRRDRARGRVARERLPHRGVRDGAQGHLRRLRARRGPAPRPLRHGARAIARHPARAALRAAPARGGGRAPRRPDNRAGERARPRPAGPAPRGLRRHAPLPDHDRGGRGRRISSSTSRPSATPSKPAQSRRGTRRRGRRRRWRARRGRGGSC